MVAVPPAPSLKSGADSEVTSREPKVREGRGNKEVRLKEARTWSLGLEEAEGKEIAPDADLVDQIR